MAQDNRYAFVLFALRCVFALTPASDGNPAEMKWHSPDVPMVADDGLLERRVKRGTSGSRLTYEERLEFLRTHNDFRANADPVASDMQFMVWHEELAAMAQEWADGCEWKHGNPERDPKPFPGIGQNLYMTTAQSVTGTTVTTSWYNEVTDYSYSSNTCAENKVCGHYTQVVWANSDNVGCAKTLCDELAGLNTKNAIFVVCNYGPAGNYVGKRPYVTGPKCSACPEDKPSCENGLCVSDPKCGNKTCENGGTLDAVSCECFCAEGYNGDTCTSAGHPSGPIRTLHAFTCLLVVAMVNKIF